MTSKEWNLKKGLEAPWEMPLKAWVKSQCPRGSIQKEKRRGNQIQEVCGLALLPALRVSRFSINSSGENGTKMWVRPHEDMHGPRKDLSLCSNSCPSSRWCHPTILSSIIPLLLPPSVFSSVRVFFQWVGSWYQVAKVLELQHQSFQWTFRVAFL